MLQKISRVAALLLLAQSAVGLPPAEARPAARVFVPTPNPAHGDGDVPAFYHWTRSIPAMPGKLLKTEPLPAGLGLENAGSAMRILYTSHDSDSRRIVVSGAYFVPRGTPPQGGWPLVAWAHGTTGMADKCSPSTFPRTARDREYLNRWLDAGFAIVASDYEGLGTPGRHTYTDFRSHAFAMLNSVRAVRRAATPLSGKVLLLGHSQGAGTAVAAAGYAPDYAPDIRIAGTVATGVPNMIRTAIEAGVPASARGIEASSPYLMMAWEWRQSGTAPPDSEMFTPEGLMMGERINSMCYFEFGDELRRLGLLPDRLLQPGTIARTFRYNLDKRAYPTLRLAQPLFIGQGDRDATTTAAGALALAKEFCSAGSIVEAHLYAGKDHSSTVNASSPDGIRFARKVLQGTPITSVCEPLPQ